MSAININHDTETITTENDNIIKIAENGALLIGDGTNVGAGGNPGVLRINTSTQKLEISNGTNYKKIFNEDDQIDTVNIADDAITTDKILDGSVTFEKLASALTTNALDKTLNLIDLTNVPAARTNLGLGTAALLDENDILKSSNNFSDVADPTTALTTLNGTPQTRNITTGAGLSGGGDLSSDRTISVDSTVVRTTRTLTAGVGLTGGGDLSVNRTISADIASQAEAEAGSVDTKLMTPLKVSQAITAKGSTTATHFYMIADTGGTVNGSTGSTTVTGTKETTVSLSSNLTANGKYLLTDLEVMTCYRRKWANFSSGATYINCVLEASTELGWISIKAWSDLISYGSTLSTGNLDLYSKFPKDETMIYSSRGINGPIIFSASPSLRLRVRLSNTQISPIMKTNGQHSTNVSLANSTSAITNPSAVSSIVLVPASGCPAGWQYGWYAGGLVKGTLLQITDNALPAGGWDMGNPSGSSGHSDWSSWIGK